MKLINYLCILICSITIVIQFTRLLILLSKCIVLAIQNKNFEFEGMPFIISISLSAGVILLNILFKTL